MSSLSAKKSFRFLMAAFLMVVATSLFVSCIPTKHQRNKFGMVYYMRQAGLYGWDCRTTGKKAFHCWRREGF